MTICRIIEGVRVKNFDVTLLFVNLSKIFKTMHRGNIEQILQAYDLPKETVAAIIMSYTNTKVMVRSPDEDTDFFNIVGGVLQRDIIASY